MMSSINKQRMVAEHDALPGRAASLKLPEKHFVSGRTLCGKDGQLSQPAGFERAMFGMGCFWGAERKFWILDGVYLTAVGYAAGFTPNPNYEEVCSGQTGHNEVVALVFDPESISYAELLQVFWESHNPTQGMRQGNDGGTQYRSGIYCYRDAQEVEAQHSAREYQLALTQSGFSTITTEIIDAPQLYFAEEYHQQYLAKNPGGYCGLGGTGVGVKVSC